MKNAGQIRATGKRGNGKYETANAGLENVGIKVYGKH